jgi:ubiquinone/menaquinone biosynthesis C-methylase UbiE
MNEESRKTGNKRLVLSSWFPAFLIFWRLFMLPRVLEPEVMDTAEEARDYDAMDHSEVNRLFVSDFLARWPGHNPILDVGAGTAQIPIELCRRAPNARVVAIDLAEEMLAVGRANVQRAGLAERLRLGRVDAKQMPYTDASFGAVISNSIVHHIPEPLAVLAEMVRVCAAEGLLFVRDLLRPADESSLRHLVATYAGDANQHQQQMFADSLRAALTLAEIRALVNELRFDPSKVEQTSDRHWTWAAAPQK